MTDKQIIIDDVDVSKCENLMQGIVPFGCMEDRKTCSCMNNPNCLYKQFKRKEQECEELKEKYKWYDHYKEQALYNKNLCNEKSEQLDQLKAENEGLKKERNKLKKQYRKNRLDRKQAEQKLGKIQGIAKDFHYAIIPFHRGINHKMSDRIDYYLNQILQIINEVE